jgi:hypothetical protein
MRPWSWYARETASLIVITAAVWLVAKLTGFL